MGHYASEMFITGSRKGDEEYFQKLKEKKKKEITESIQNEKDTFFKFKKGSKIRLKKKYNFMDLSYFGYSDNLVSGFMHIPKKFRNIVSFVVHNIDKKEKQIYLKGMLGIEFKVDHRFFKVVD